MARHLSCALAALLLMAAPVRAVALCSHTDEATSRQNPGGKGRPDQEKRQPPPKWWIEEPMRGELGITDQQSAAIEQLWQKTIPKLREARERLDTMEEELSRMIRDASDEAVVVAQIEKVENTRSEANKARTLMLYRMNRVLTPDQRDKLKAMHDKFEASRRGSGDRR
jgi:Spy/CpxP family protein refolding chaperone